MIGTSWTGTNRPLVFNEKTTVLDECQISSSEHFISENRMGRDVLDECQISSSEHGHLFTLVISFVLDECQISSSEHANHLRFLRV